MTIVILTHYTLVNNAGIAFGGSITELSLQDWRRLMAVNLDGVFLGTKHAIPYMQKSGGGSIISAVSELVRTYADLLPDEEEANLTHGDYDPANIIVTQVKGKWKIAAILDWEFSFAGTYLLDIGTMLRYSHRLPSYYEKAFIAGITETVLPLPITWKKQAKLMDLLCLLQLVHYNPYSERPKMNCDLVSLIADTVKNWNNF